MALPSENKVAPRFDRRVYLIRHGDVSYFDSSGQPFRPDTVPLNDRGRRQAEHLAQELAGIPFDQAWCSDLPRCVETATRILAGHEVPCQPSEALREIRPGRLADIPTDQLRSAFLDVFQVPLDPNARFLGGETFASLWERVGSWWRDRIDDGTWRTMLVVAHGGVNRAILTLVIGFPLSHFLQVEQDPACVNAIDVDRSGKGLIRLMNYTPYDSTKRESRQTTMERLYQEYLAGR